MCFIEKSFIKNKRLNSVFPGLGQVGVISRASAGLISKPMEFGPTYYVRGLLLISIVSENLKTTYTNTIESFLTVFGSTSTV